MISMELYILIIYVLKGLKCIYDSIVEQNDDTSTD